MFHPAFFKSMISLLASLGQLADYPFEGNPDYLDYWALFTAQPLQGSYASVEAQYAGYARQHYSRNPTIWLLNDGPPFFAGNRDLVTFPQPTGGAGEVLTHWGWLYPEAGSGGSTYGLVVSGPLENPITVAVGQTILFPVNTLVVKSPS